LVIDNILVPASVLTMHWRNMAAKLWVVFAFWQPERLLQLIQAYSVQTLLIFI